MITRKSNFQVFNYAIFQISALKIKLLWIARKQESDGVHGDSVNNRAVRGEMVKHLFAFTRKHNNACQHGLVIRQVG